MPVARKKTVVKTAAAKPASKVSVRPKISGKATDKPAKAASPALSVIKKTSAKSVTKAAPKAKDAAKKDVAKPSAKVAPQAKVALEKSSAAPQNKIATAKRKLAAAKPVLKARNAKKASSKTDSTTTSRAPKTQAIKAEAPGKGAAKTITKTVVKTAVKNARKTVARVAAAPLKAADIRVAEPAVKARRVRAPKDLAVQYGESVKQKRVVETTATKRARRDAVVRQKMRDAMEVDDDLIARLRRAGVMGGDEETASPNGHRARHFTGGGSGRRPRKWEGCCGKCGGKSLFKTAAGLCAKCGAIMVRE